MVTSVLERNGSAPAETLKPKEAAVPAPPPPVALVAEKQAPPALQPLPEFPEGGTDDPSLAYGFGSGRRALDDEAEESGETPASVSADGKHDEDEFEGASTTKEWRRSAMEFEIPEETSRRPAFHSEEDSEATFPSEKDVPPTHIRVPSGMGGLERVALQSSEHEAPLAARLGAETVNAAGCGARPDEGPANPAFEPAASERRVTPTAVMEGSRTPAAGDRAAADPSVASKAAHWMDLMAAPTERPLGDWFTSTFGSHSRPGAEENRGEPGTGLPFVAEEAEAPKHELDPELFASVDTAPAEDAGLAPPPEEPFFADEAEERQPVFGVTSAESVAVASNEPESHARVTAEAEASSTAEAPLVEEPAGSGMEEASESFPPGAAATLPEASAELVTEASDEPAFEKDPNLIEPAVVHVTPEPLLIDETPRESLIYAAREQETAPLYSFLSATPVAPAPADPEEESPEKLPEQSSGEGSADDPIGIAPAGAEAIQGHANPETPRVEDFSAIPEKEEAGRALEFSSSEFRQAALTSPLPIREALAHIPFLNPPPEFCQSEAATPKIEESQSATVDAVVQKVLEKIEPRIRELLSQNALKPLVEDLLQDELKKNER
jgi:hypothetical protein